MKLIRIAQKVNTTLVDIATGRFLYAGRSTGDDAAQAIQKQTELEKEAFDHIEKSLTNIMNNQRNS